jgi:hypothetical protein
MKCKRCRKRPRTLRTVYCKNCQASLSRGRRMELVRAAGLCTKCKRVVASPGHKTCAPCRKAITKRHVAEQQHLRAQGNCVVCAKPAMRKLGRALRHCARCRKRHLAAQARHSLRKKLRLLLEPPADPES